MNRRDIPGLAALTALAGGVVLALTAPLFVPPDALSATHAANPPLQPPSMSAPLGTDVYGRSMVAVTIWGARVSLTVGLLATVVSVGIGSLAGIVAGHFPRGPGTVIMRITDWFLALPTIVLAAALVGVGRPGTGPIILAIGLTSWPGTARLIRAQTLAVEAEPYVDRARALGAGDWHLLCHHVLGAVAPLVLVQAALTVPAAILAEAALAFLGLSDPTALSWGSTLQQARQAGAVSAGDWWMLAPPGLAITAVSLAFTVCGRWLEQTLQPRLLPVR